MKFDDILQSPPFLLSKNAKNEILTTRLLELTEYHRKNCQEYQDILNSISYDREKVSSYTDIPFLPVRLFKERELKSVPKEDVIKVMTSSGTSGQAVSKIYLDRTTSGNQQRAMVKIMNDFLGANRMPMIILDCPSVIKDRNMFTARGAGILGFSIFGAQKIYALNDNMQLNVDLVKSFLEKYQSQKILLFGFTFIVWQHFYKELIRLLEKDIRFDLSNGILIHGGGWKKLISDAVSPEEFHNRLRDVCGLDSIHDYYGMVEQTGCIYMQCEKGHLHASIFSDVIIRNPENFSECVIGERGIVQVVSTIPESYPGHSLLTEDEGVILGEDDCPCGRKGKYFKILGRLKNAEIRGCSDTYASDLSKKQLIIKDDDDLLDKITYLVGNKNTIKNISALPAKRIFDNHVVDFLNDLSKELMKSSAARTFTDVVSLGFWIRKASINKLKQRFLSKDDNIHIGKGVVFHIAPSNVPVNYAYSLIVGLLCGNSNVVRIPSRDFPQISLINDAIKKVLEIYPEIKKYICLVRYDKNSFINDKLSSMCNVRIIWGGDKTIAEIRNSQLVPRATEITFADRFSLMLIDSDSYMKIEDKNRIASEFYNDTYLNDQNACTSPRVIVWIGNHKLEAQNVFWDTVYKLVEKRYHYQSIMGVDKLTQGFLAVTAKEDLGDFKIFPNKDNRLVRIKVTKLRPGLMLYRGNSGYFYEYDCNNIMDIFDFCNDSRCQTVGIIGSTDMLKPLLLSGLKGVDRVAKVGHTMDFDLNWDGYNLVEQLTRTIVI